MKTEMFGLNLQSLHFLLVITKPTRFSHTDQRPISAPSLLDHIWINFDLLFTSGILYSDITDHCPTFLLLRSAHNVSENLRLSFRCQKPENHDKFYNDLQTVNWLEAWSGNWNDKDSYIMDRLDELYCKNFPVMNKYISLQRFSKPWITPRLLELVKLKSLSFKLYKRGIVSHNFNKSFKNKLN